MSLSLQDKQSVDMCSLSFRQIWHKNGAAETPAYLLDSSGSEVLMLEYSVCV